MHSWFSYHSGLHASSYLYTQNILCPLGHVRVARKSPAAEGQRWQLPLWSRPVVWCFPTKYACHWKNAGALQRGYVEIESELQKPMVMWNSSGNVWKLDEKWWKAYGNIWKNRWMSILVGSSAPLGGDLKPGVATPQQSRTRPSLHRFSCARGIPFYAFEGGGQELQRLFKPYGSLSLSIWVWSWLSTLGFF